MAGQVSIMDIPMTVATALTNGVNRYKAVVISADNTVNYAAASNATKFIGIAQEDKDAGLTANIRTLGVTFAIATAAITAGDDLVIGDASGGVATAVGVSTPNVIGKALSSASAAGDLFLMLVKA